MKKESKATRIRKLVLAGFRDVAIAKLVKCHVSYVWQVRKKLEKDIDTDTRVNMDAHSSGVQFDTPKSILDEAKDIIYGDREKTYGAPDKNLVAIETPHDTKCFAIDHYIAQVVHFVIWAYCVVPPPNHFFIHFGCGIPRAKLGLTVTTHEMTDTVVPKVRVAYKKNCGHIRLLML